MFGKDNGLNHKGFPDAVVNFIIANRDNISKPEEWVNSSNLSNFLNRKDINDYIEKNYGALADKYKFFLRNLLISYYANKDKLSVTKVQKKVPMDLLFFNHQEVA